MEGIRVLCCVLALRAGNSGRGYHRVGFFAAACGCAARRREGDVEDEGYSL